MPSASPSPIRGSQKSSFHTSLHTGKQYDYKPALQIHKPVWSWPEKEKIYRKRMAGAKIGSKYDCKQKYLESHVLNRSQTPSGSSSSSTDSESIVRDQERENLRESSEENRKVQERKGLEDLYKRADVPKSYKDTVFIPWWGIWVQNHILQPLEDNLKAVGSQTLEQRRKAAEEAYEAARKEAEAELARRRATEKQECVPLQPHSRPSISLEKLPGRYEACLVCDELPADDVTVEMLISKIGSLAKVVASMGSFGILFAFASFAQTVKASGISMQYNTTGSNATTFGFQTSQILSSFIELLLVLINFLISFYINFIFLALTLLVLYVFRHTIKVLGSLVLFFLHTLFSLVFDIFIEGGFDVRGPLLVRCALLKFYNLLVWIRDAGLLYNAYCVLVFSFSLLWQYFGPPAWEFYLESILTSEILHWVSLKLRRLATVRFWFWLGVGVAALNWLWLIDWYGFQGRRKLAVDAGKAFNKRIY